jgi:transposase
MLAVVWNRERSHVVDVLRKGATFETDSYCEGILSEISRACLVHSNRRLVIHADNAGPHALKRTGEFMEKNNLRRVSHPPFSPDLATAEFLLFGCIKRKL